MWFFFSLQIHILVSVFVSSQSRTDLKLWRKKMKEKTNCVELQSPMKIAFDWFAEALPIQYDLFAHSITNYAIINANTELINLWHKRKEPWKIQSKCKKRIVITLAYLFKQNNWLCTDLKSIRKFAFFFSSFNHSINISWLQNTVSCDRKYVESIFIYEQI